MESTGKYTATLNVSKSANAKTTPDYELRLNQDDCTTIELKQVDTEEESFDWSGGALLPRDSSKFNGYDAFYFMKTADFVPEEFDTKIGYCICDSDTGVCESFIMPEVLNNGYNDRWSNVNGAYVAPQ